jgi:hypothetical protein
MGITSLRREPLRRSPPPYNLSHNGNLIDQLCVFTMNSYEVSHIDPYLIRGFKKFWKKLLSLIAIGFKVDCYIFSSIVIESLGNYRGSPTLGDSMRIAPIYRSPLSPSLGLFMRDYIDRLRQRKTLICI